MKKLIHINYIIYLAVFIFIPTACKKGLDKSPLDRFASDQFWTNETNAQLALVSVYKGTILTGAIDNGPSDWWSYSGMLFLEFATDNAYDRRGETSPFVILTNGAQTSSNTILSSYWNSSYGRIAQCNDFLENIGKVTMADARKARMIAEVRFIRACQYFYMSQYWGSVPLVKKVLTAQEANNLDKAPKSEIVTFVIDELKAAAADLPRFKDIPGSEAGRASRQAALAFLGRMQLAEGKFADAAVTYKTIIDFGDNIIDPDYSSIFLEANENSKENIFSTQYLGSVAGSALLQHCMPLTNGGNYIIDPLGSLIEKYQFKDGTPFSYSDPRYNYKDITSNRDPRLKYSVLTNADPFKGGVFKIHPDSTLSADRLGSLQKTGYLMKKYLDESYTGNYNTYGGNVPVIRYAEVLLSYLEAALEAGQPITQSLLDATINKVRGRASVGMPPVSQTDPAVLRNILRDERRIELAFEGIRYWDLLRWKIADQVLNGDFYGAPFPGSKAAIRKKGTTTDPYSRWYVTTKAFRKGKDELWPIPQSEVNINPKLQ